jgi:hypothetical protein
VAGGGSGLSSSNTSVFARSDRGAPRVAPVRMGPLRSLGRVCLDRDLGYTCTVANLIPPVLQNVERYWSSRSHEHYPYWHKFLFCTFQSAYGADHTGRSKAWTVFTRSNTGVVSSNPTWAADVSLCFFCVFVVMCVGNGIATGVLPPVYRLKNWKGGKGPQEL